MGTLLAAAFIIFVFSIALHLFNKPAWFNNMKTYFGGGLVALALIMFALELNGDA